MRRITQFLLSILLILTLLLMSACQSGAEKQPTGEVNLQITQIDTSEFPLVRVYISVRDINNEPLAINPAKLVLKENGVPIDPQSIQGTDTVEELTSLLVVDVSGSMDYAGKMDAAKTAARDYFSQMRPLDQSGIIAFNTQVNVVQNVTNDQAQLTTAVDKLSASGDTAMFDALIKAVEILNPISGRKAIIVLTDGMDNASTNTAEDVLMSIGYKGLSISTIGMGILPEGEEEPDKYKGLDQPTLTMLAERAGGRYGFVEDTQALAELYDQMRRALQSEIVISYITPLKLRDGVNRALSLSLAEDWTGISAEEQARFNPGGLVPEVAQPASWLIIGILLAVLIFLLVIPSIVGAIRHGGGKPGRKKKTRIKLLD